MKFAVLSLFLIIGFATSVKVNCIYKSTVWPTTGRVYCCYAQSLEVFSQDDVIEAIEGTHIDGKSDSDVHSIWIEKSPNLLYMPRGFEKFFKNLEGICINDSGMKQLTKKDLEPFPRLQGIWFYGNQLTTLSDDIFQSNPLLRHLDFGRNRIRLMSASIMDPVRKPKVIKFNGNICINKDVLNYEVEEIKQEIDKECTKIEIEIPPEAECECAKLINENKELVEKEKKSQVELQSYKELYNNPSPF